MKTFTGIQGISFYILILLNRERERLVFTDSQFHSSFVHSGSLGQATSLGAVYNIMERCHIFLAEECKPNNRLVNGCVMQPYYLSDRKGPRNGYIMIFVLHPRSFVLGEIENDSNTFFTCRSATLLVCVVPLGFNLF